MSALWQLAPGERVWEAATYYDDGDNPIAEEGPSTYATSERQAEAFAHQALNGRRPEHNGGFWYATIRRGPVVDPNRRRQPTRQRVRAGRRLVAHAVG